jgi:hypothetical protein
LQGGDYKRIEDTDEIGAEGPLGIRQYIGIIIAFAIVWVCRGGTTPRGGEIIRGRVIALREDCYVRSDE